MNLTFDEAIENHRKMWNWIADKTEERKTMVCKHDYFYENALPCAELLCFCCEYTITNLEVDCGKCPIDWGVDENCIPCSNPKSPYWKWRNADYWQTAANYARQIANLPVREEVREHEQRGN